MIKPAAPLAEKAEIERLRAALDAIASPPDQFGWWTALARQTLGYATPTEQTIADRRAVETNENPDGWLVESGGHQEFFHNLHDANLTAGRLTNPPGIVIPLYRRAEKTPERCPDGRRKGTSPLTAKNLAARIAGAPPEKGPAPPFVRHPDNCICIPPPGKTCAACGRTGLSAERAAALDEMVRISQAIGGYDLDAETDPNGKSV